MTYYVDGVDTARNPHVNYEPTSRGGPAGGHADRAAPTSRWSPAKWCARRSAGTNDYGQAGERYRTFEPWERDELISQPGDAARAVQPGHPGADGLALQPGDAEYGRRVAEGLGICVADVPPAPESRIADHGDVGPRDGCNPGRRWSPAEPADRRPVYYCDVATPRSGSSG